MARKAGVEWKAVGASLDDVARTCRALPARTPSAFAYSSSGVLQQAAVVFLSRYITPANYSSQSGSRQTYTAPPGATHGPVKKTNKDEQGNYVRDSKGRFIYAFREKKIFIKGQFVSRTGQMRAFANELASTPPTDSVGVTLAHAANVRTGNSAELTAGIDANGNGFVELTGGYRAAEVGSRSGRPMGVKGWWRSLRSVQGRYATLLKKKYADLLVPKSAGR